LTAVGPRPRDLGGLVSFDVDVAAALTKHDIAGIVCAVGAVILLVFGGVRLAARAAMAIAVLVLGALAVLLAVLFFTRAI